MGSAASALLRTTISGTLIRQTRRASTVRTAAIWPSGVGV